MTARRLLVLLTAFALVAASCTGDDEDTTTTTETTVPATTTSVGDATTTTEASTTTTEPTTVGGSEPAYLGVRLDNAPGTAQFGLEAAEVVLETMVEGGLTRLTALYRDDAPRLAGPVRSLRPVDDDLLPPFGTLLVTSGGTPFVRQLVEAAGVVLLGPESGVLTDTGDQPPNHLATNPAALLEGAELGGRPTPFGDGPPPDGDDAETVTVEVAPEARVVEWSWTGSTWTRSQDGSPHQTLDDEREATDVTADVVLVLQANVRSAGYSDTAGFPVFDYDVIGGGDWTLLADGTVASGRWQRDSLAATWVLTDAEGEVVGLPDGRLWVMVVATEAELTTE